MPRPRIDVAIRPLAPEDVEHVKWALYEAVAWNPERVLLPPFELTIEHPELARYHRGWGRTGDIGVIAESGVVVGVALCRLFTENDHGHGYVDERTPELAVAVAEDRRANGIGTRLMEALAESARAAGFSSLSLSVDAENPALRLYERLGYRELTRDDDGVRMIIDL